MSQFRETAFQLDPKKRTATVKRGNATTGGKSDVPADPLAVPESLSGLVKIGVDDLRPEFKDWLLAQIRKTAATPSSDTQDVAYVLADVPRLLPGDPRLLCLPAFADLFVLYLHKGEPAEVKKTLLSLHKQALKRYRAALRSLPILIEEQGTLEEGRTPLAVIAHRHKLSSVSEVKKRLSEARRLLGRPLRRRDKEKTSKRKKI